MTHIRNSFAIRTDLQSGFQLIGDGQLGGKAEGLVSLSALLKQNAQWGDIYPQVRILIPETLIITGTGFEAFIEHNQLGWLSSADIADSEIVLHFLNGHLPDDLRNCLENYLSHHTYPLAVRSSGMLEDAHLHAYAGLYLTYMLSNDQAYKSERLALLCQAIKLVFASSFFNEPRSYATRVGHNLEKDRMAVIIQQVAGQNHGVYYYPTFSGVADSQNYYPMAGMKSEDGTAAIAIGLGKQVVSGERALRFSPKYPRRLVQRTAVEEMLAYGQRRLYVLRMGTKPSLEHDDHGNLVRLNIADVEDQLPMDLLAGTYVHAEHRVRESVNIPGPRVVTFAGILKYNLFPLAGILQDILAAAEQMIQMAVELEFAVNIAPGSQCISDFFLLQLRPMAARSDGGQVHIRPEEPGQAICYTENAMGNVNGLSIYDIVYVKPNAFDSGRTREVAAQLAKINASLVQQKRPYVLVGPGRWGSADPWLGIPVRWSDISGAGAIVETISEKLKADPSLGAHFFHNLTALGISYLCVTRRPPDHFNWSWITAQKISWQDRFVAHVQLEQPVKIKVDGRTSRGIIAGKN